MTSPTPDAGPTWRYLVGIAAMIAFAVIGFEVKANADRVSSAEARNSRQDVEIGILQAQAEARARQLDRIENKLDRLMETTGTP